MSIVIVFQAAQLSALQTDKQIRRCSTLELLAHRPGDADDADDDDDYADADADADDDADEYDN